MAARKVNTPGATPKPEEKEVTQPTTAEQADAALESITGADPSTNENAPEVALVPVEQFDAVAQKLAEAEAKIKELEAKSKASTKSAAPAQPIQSQTEVKRIQNVLTDRGWDSVEE
ncbi:hypothetical protein [Acinetobacter sp. ASP199]|uniref:hypothetical protein n=1 Tax=unclassified Acinetobacter TaxID=196816 RepID=UPI001F6161D2|nr:hypothetical protein [Acinetobacter sp. ASP199]UNT60458.1 hypothetical protein IHE35_06570 [Acinetobacter sp. ASP199]